MAKIGVRLMVSMPYLVLFLLSNKRLILKQSSISCHKIEIILDTKKPTHRQSGRWADSSMRDQ